MSISVNGQSQVPPGFRFHPTEEELLQYYLKKKVGLEKIDLDVIQDVDLNKLEPWDIQEKCRIGSTPQNDWYFFSHKDKKYPTGTRTNRATTSGFWKATGRDKVIYGNSRRIGMRKTLVFYKGRAPHGQKSDWIMHEYRLDDPTAPPHSTNVCNGSGEGGQEEGWVVCRVFKKKNLITHKISDSSLNTTTWSSSINSCNQGTLEEMLHSMASPSTTDDLIDADNTRRFSKLPGLYNTPNSSCRTQTNSYMHMFADDIADVPPFLSHSDNTAAAAAMGIQDWAALDRLVASHLNGQNDAASKQMSLTTLSHGFGCPVDHGDHQLLQLQHQRSSTSSSSSSRRYGGGAAGAGHDYQSEGDLWSFAPTSNDQLCDVHPI